MRPQPPTATRLSSLPPYDPRSRSLDCVNAGHNPPILLRNGQVIRLETGGPVVGLLPFAPYVEQTLTLEPGDCCSSIPTASAKP